MLTKWEFWMAVMGLGAVAFGVGVAGRWQTEEPYKYSDEVTWLIRIGVFLLVIGVIGLVYSYFASRWDDDRAVPRIEISAESKGQRGGTTVGLIVKKDANDE